jgi:hypothetical protein
MKGDIKFKLKMDNGIITREYSLSDVIEYASDLFWEDLEREYGCDGHCTNESVAHCECGPVFENNKFVEIIIQ